MDLTSRQTSIRMNGEFRAMNFRRPFLLLFAVAALFLSAAKPAYQVEAVASLPEGVPPAIAAVLDPKGHSVAGPDGKLCQIWLVKNVELQPAFQPTNNVKYPFQAGQLIGLLNVEKKTRFEDFRGQRVRSGLYTLRYGKQPEDGNHIGTSELADYLLAIPVAVDTKPDKITPNKKLHEQSAKTTRATHPAVFSLMAADKPGSTEKSKPTAYLDQVEGRELWIFNTTAHGKDGDKTFEVPIRLVVVGKTQAA
jgi:hypothetical protein